MASISVDLLNLFVLWVTSSASGLSSGDGGGGTGGVQLGQSLRSSEIWETGCRSEG